MNNLWFFLKLEDEVWLQKLVVMWSCKNDQSNKVVPLIPFKMETIFWSWWVMVLLPIPNVLWSRKIKKLRMEMMMSIMTPAILAGRLSLGTAANDTSAVKLYKSVKEMSDIDGMINLTWLLNVGKWGRFCPFYSGWEVLQISNGWKNHFPEISILYGRCILAVGTFMSTLVVLWSCRFQSIEQSNCSLAMKNLLVLLQSVEEDVVANFTWVLKLYKEAIAEENNAWVMKKIM